MTAEIISFTRYRKAPGCPRCGAVDHEVDLAGWRWGTCRAHRLKWKISTALNTTSATDIDFAIKYLANFWPAERMRQGAGPNAA